MIWPFKKDRVPDIRFVPTRARPDIGAPVLTAKTAPRPDWLNKQASKPPLKFAHCPGMWDYYQMGYILPAWCDIHVKVNKHGVSIRMEGSNHDDRFPAGPMDFSLVDGLFPIEDGIAKAVMKIPAPWAVITRPGVSALLLPATMHSNHTDKMAVYPGRVSYDKGFHTINVIATFLKECEFTIWAGEPLLQVVPIIDHDWSAEVGPATPREEAESRFGFISRKIGHYRKLFHTKQKYNIAVRDDR